jgi:hypothetical protein
MLDVLCGQNAEAVDRCNDAIDDALRTLATGEPELAVRAIKALRTMPHLPTSQKRAAPDAATVDVLAAALDRFRVAGNWTALQETMLTVSQLFDGDWPMPPNLLRAAVRVVHVHVTDVRKNTLWRHAALLARKDASGQFLADLCDVCVDVTHHMAVDMNEPATEDLIALEFLLNDMYRSQPLDRRHKVTRALVDTGMLKSAKYLLQSHGMAVEGYVNLLSRVWGMAELLDDAEFTSLVTKSDGHLQRLQDAVGWTVDVKATRERILKLGVEWSVPAPQVAAKVREAEARAQAEAATTVREAVARAEKAEAEIARLNAVVRQSLDKVLDMQSKASTPHTTDSDATATAAPAATATAECAATATAECVATATAECAATATAECAATATAECAATATPASAATATAECAATGTAESAATATPASAATGTAECAATAAAECAATGTAESEAPATGVSTTSAMEPAKVGVGTSKSRWFGQVVYVTGPVDVDKRTLAKKIAAAGRGVLIETYDGGDEWDVLQQVISAASSAHNVLVLVSDRHPTPEFEAHCIQSRQVMHLCQVAADPHDVTLLKEPADGSAFLGQSGVYRIGTSAKSFWVVGRYYGSLPACIREVTCF